MNRIDRVSRVVTAPCLIALVCASQAARSQQLTSAEAAWAAMTKCAAIAAADARHACADDVMRSAGLLPVTQAQPAGASPARDCQATAPLPQKDDKQQVTLAAVEQGGDGKLVLTTTEGAIWRQAERIVIFPLPQQGQTLTITKTSFGGFMCKPSKWVAFRCYRAR